MGPDRGHPPDRGAGRDRHRGAGARHRRRRRRRAGTARPAGRHRGWAADTGRLAGRAAGRHPRTAARPAGAAGERCQRGCTWRMALRRRARRSLAGLRHGLDRHWRRRRCRRAHPARPPRAGRRDRPYDHHQRGRALRLRCRRLLRGHRLGHGTWPPRQRRDVSLRWLDAAASLGQRRGHRPPCGRGSAAAGRPRSGPARRGGALAGRRLHQSPASLFA